jgi:enediyne biosynthesis protein E3
MITLVSLLAISPRETSFEVRGFHLGSPAARRVLEEHGASFVGGYNAALQAGGIERLARRLDQVPLPERGFAYEGAAMALALRDLLIARPRDRLAALLRGPGHRHVYMIHVGAGWALARLRLRPRRRLPALDPFLRWLALDGYGFHEAFFHAVRTVSRRTVPHRLAGYERRAFDQGVGRALWFVDGGDVERAARTLERFPSGRRPDLWSGLGLAAAYTAAAGAEDLVLLRTLAGVHAPQVAQGAAFAIAARDRAGNVIEATRTAAAVLCKRNVEQVVDVVREARLGLVADPDGRGYECWRTLLGQRLTERTGSLVA